MKTKYPSGTYSPTPRKSVNKSIKHGVVNNVLTTPEDASVRGHLNSKKRSARGGVVDRTVSAGSHGSLGDGRKVGDGGMKRMRNVSMLKMVAISLVCLLVVVGIGVGVAAFVFLGGLDAKLALTENAGTEVAAQESSVADVLTSVSGSEAYYTLVAADLDGQGDAGLGDGPDAITLVRCDPSTKQVTLLELPVETQMSLADGRTHQIRDAYDLDGTAAFISDVSSLTGVSISHFVYVTAQGLVDYVDALGGIDVNLTEEVDDPTAGDAFIAAGEQTLGGREALTVARATNYENGRTTQAATHAALLAAIAQKAMGQGSIELFMNLDKLSGGVSCDMSAQGVANLADGMRGFDTATVMSAVLPGYESSEADATYYILRSSSVSTMIDRVDAGQTPVEEEQKVSVDPQSFTITVRNGGGVTGAAASAAELLTAQNYKVEDMGNTDTQAYDETLVIYEDDKFADAAQALVDELGRGRTVQSNGIYTFETDVLVIVGKDFAVVN